MTPIFNWVPQKDYTVTETPNVSVVTFGDGYEQRKQKGINPLLSKYSALTFIGVDGLCGKPNIAKEVRAFLKERGLWSRFSGHHQIRDSKGVMSAVAGLIPRTASFIN